jgi:hypothetical protein
MNNRRNWHVAMVFHGMKLTRHPDESGRGLWHAHRKQHDKEEILERIKPSKLALLCARLPQGIRAVAKRSRGT